MPLCWIEHTEIFSYVLISGFTPRHMCLIDFNQQWNKLLHWNRQWLCSHGLESRSERRFGSWSKTSFGTWFELHAFTCIANAFPITIRICALWGNILLLLRSPRTLIDGWPMRLCMDSACIFKMHTHESRSERALRSHVLESGFLGGSRSKTLFFRVSKRISKAWFETALHSHGLKSGFQIRRGPNHVLKCLSERYSIPCEHSQSWSFIGLFYFCHFWFNYINP